MARERRTGDWLRGELEAIGGALARLGHRLVGQRTDVRSATVGSSAAGTDWRRVARIGVAVALDLAIVIVLAALPVLYFWRLLATGPGLPGGTEMMTIGEGDFIDLHFPYHQFIADELARGHLPVWNPYISAGHPALGDPQFGVLYPIGTWLYQIVGRFDFRVLEWQVAIHYGLAAVFAFLLGRRFFRSRTAALVTSLTFAYGGYFISFPVQQLNVLETLIWLPLILLFLDLAIDYRSPALAIPAGLALTLACLAGHPQSLLYVLLGSGAYFVYRCWDRGWHLAELAVAGVFLGVGFGLAAPQLIPAYQHLLLTSRTDVTFSYAYPGFTFHQLIGAIIPFHFGGEPLYQGLLPLALVGVALLRRGASRARGFWLGTGVVSFLLSFGGNTFLLSILYLAVPFLRFRQHERASILVSLAVAVLAGYGVDALRRQWIDRSQLVRYLRWLLWPLGAIAVFGLVSLLGAIGAQGDARGVFEGLADRAFLTLILLGLSIFVLALQTRGRQNRLWPVLAVGLVWVDLFSTGYGWGVRLLPPERIYPNTPTTTFLQAHSSPPGSVANLSRVSTEGLLQGDGNAGSVYRVNDIVGNSPLELADYQRFGGVVEEVQRLRLLNVRYLVTRRDLGADPRFKLALTDGDFRTYELRPDLQLPRAWIVHEAVFADDPAGAILLANTIDPKTQAVVEDVAAWRAAGVGLAGGADESVTVRAFEPDRLLIHAQLARSGLLVLSEIYHQDWQVIVDGVPSTILRADGVLRGVLLTAGEHDVEMRFVSAGFARGLALANLATKLAVVLAVLEMATRTWWWLRHRQAPVG